MVGEGGAKQRSILGSGARTRRSGALESARAPPPRARLRFALRAPEPGAARWANGEARRGVPRRRGGAACGGGPRLGRGVRKKREINSGTPQRLHVHLFDAPIIRYCRAQQITKDTELVRST